MVLSNQPDIPIFPPGDLLSDEPPLETYRHLKQLIVLLTSLERFWGDRQGWLWSEELKLYLGVVNDQVRFFTPAGELVFTPEEAEIQERQRAENIQAENDRLRQKLLELGINPNEL
ncbi:MAG: hypothetical protein HC866_15940 [Leptolyngbyaceae cyanobacterium RU_5_1]|nr:hypothetical protein [Leptolyngbyaceae cyanobacterium RU_5_1]